MTDPRSFAADEPLPAGWVGERTPDTGWTYRFDPEHAAWLDRTFGDAPRPRRRRSPR